MSKHNINTETSSFGTIGRFSHDSCKFYNSNLYHDIELTECTNCIENVLSEDCINRIFVHSSESMYELPDNSVHLMVTSPPYNATKEYDQNLTLHQYLDLIYTVFKETYRVLIDGGRACVNIANLGRKTICSAI